MLKRLSSRAYRRFGATFAGGERTTLFSIAPSAHEVRASELSSCELVVHVQGGDLRQRQPTAEPNVPEEQQRRRESV